MKALIAESIELLKALISIPSISKEEDKTADLIQEFLEKRSIPTHRHLNNVWAVNQHFDTHKPTLLLNSHHDTVKPNTDYTSNPFAPNVEGDALYGLGSNDAGACLVSLLATFRHFYDHQNLNHNLIFLASAEEEISGKNGISAALPHLGKIDVAIVGEPTQMQMAVAEKGLMVLDCTAHGQSGHAARNEGENAIYKAIRDIEWLKNYQFPKESPWLGPVKISTTLIQAGTQHNVVPDQCTFVVDVRTTDAYSNQEVLDILKKNVNSEVNARSTRLNPSSIPVDHPLVEAGKKLGLSCYGSPTLSDQALLSCPSLKIGPGDSARSHTADEFVKLSEIEVGVEMYAELLEGFLG